MYDRERYAEEKLPWDSIASVGKIPSADQLPSGTSAISFFGEGRNRKRAKDEGKGNWVI